MWICVYVYVCTYTLCLLVLLLNFIIVINLDHDKHDTSKNVQTLKYF